MIDIKEILILLKKNEVDTFLRKYNFDSVLKTKIKYEDIKDNWKFVGDNPSNASNIHILTNPEKGLIERLTNSIDAIIEKEYLENNKKGKTVLDVVQKAFPKYYENYLQVIKQKIDKNRAYEAEGKIRLAINYGTGKYTPTFDIIDYGEGVEGKNFKDTLVSLNKGNKINSDKSYLIGAFGQGGSTSIQFASYTIIISKKFNKIFMTIIKQIQLDNYKTPSYVYLVQKGLPIELEVSSFENKELLYLNDYLNFESGTLIRMIDTAIGNKYISNDITKPTMLTDYINTELFDVKIPIKLIENRKEYVNNNHAQNRNCFGSYLKLKTTKRLLRKEYAGKIDILYKNNNYSIDYYVILPKEQEEWHIDSIAKKTMENFNVFLDPLMFIVNGQTITTEKYTKFKNRGLEFLKYRLLVIVNLDILGDKKYHFFTSNRDQIIKSDFNEGFINQIIDSICGIQELKELDKLISQKSLSSQVDKDYLKNISEVLSKEVEDMFSLENSISSKKNKEITEKSKKEEINYINNIVELTLAPKDKSFHSNQNIVLVLKTGAFKEVNENAKIDLIINEKSFINYNKNYINGRIIYEISSKEMKQAKNKVKAVYYNDNLYSDFIESNECEFEVLDSILESGLNKKIKVSPEVEISEIEGSDEILQIIENQDDNKILIRICMGFSEINNNLKNFGKTSEGIEKLRKLIIKSTSRFAILSRKTFNQIDKLEDRNDIALSFIISCIRGSKD